MLDLAKLDAHRFTVLTEEVDMGRLLERAYSTFSEEARNRGIEYTQELDGAPVIVSDGDRVLQIISNLLSNAFRWTPDGGRIDLELSSANGTVTVDVADTGPGIGTRTARADLPAVLVARRTRDRARASDRARARRGTRRPDRAGQRSGEGEPLPARPAEASVAGGLAGVAERDVRGLLGCGVLVDGVLDPLEPVADALPAGRDEVDEQGEVVEARMPLGEDVPLEPLEPANRLVQQAADLGEVAGDRQHLGAQAVVHRGADLLRQRSLELRCRLGERLDLRPRALQSRLDLGRCDPPRGRFRDPGLGPLECLFVHGREDSVPHRMEASVLDYDLPPELIAQQPAERRDSSRLLVYDRASGAVRHRVFAELPAELSGELAVVNDTRVVPARIRIEQPKGEVLLLEHEGGGEWLALARPTRRLRAGRRYGAVELIEHLGEGRWRVRLDGEPQGEAPLPPYITEPLADPSRYQTVYADESGSAAAPTAGLHFTPELLGRLDVERVTLHVGLDTFRPLTAPTLEQHELHGERYSVRPEAWERIQAAERVLAVGTTTVRVLETVARNSQLQGRTTLFVTPGFEFRRVDALLTNFHLPRSTLLALVMAFAGIEETRRLYRLAIEERYRFYSFGDAMLLL